ncbi:hypothetical protein WN51_04721 [Melipona quadrifasciata]|uniref:Uncharacterized protein n=1 Tax=Melipona quadrifasciata TaxID=166423 RepID=A0A0N0BDE2_9HYME|nr:hypothetical protein WN51_04721 [Melipona quadrifasciata]
MYLEDYTMSRDQGSEDLNRMYTLFKMSRCRTSPKEQSYCPEQCGICFVYVPALFFFSFLFIQFCSLDFDD